MLSISCESHLIRHSGTGRRFEDTQRALGRHSGTWKLRGHWALGHSKSTRRTLGPLRHLGTRALKVLAHTGTWALEALHLADSEL